MSLFAVGTKIRMIHTGDIGTISDLLADGMATVILADGDEIPVFLEDIQNIEDERRALSSKPPVQAKVVPTKQPKVEKPPVWPDPIPQYAILKSLGIQLAFDPHLRADGTPGTYTVYLINDTPSDVLYSYQLSRRQSRDLKQNGKLNQQSALEVDQISFDDLNEGPSVQLECWQITTMGTGKKLTKSTKIKAKQFFKNKRTAPILGREVHHYVIFDQLESTQKAGGEDLQTYTKRMAAPTGDWDLLNRYVQHDVSDFANFDTVLDLHIEHLVPTVKGLSNAEMLAIQIQAMETYLARAIELGVDSVFIIHGLGKGRLKERVSLQLEQHPGVKKFRNEYHHKFGYGATEVWL